MREPATLEQLPRSSQDYYASVSHPGQLFEQRHVGTDACNRRVYQKYLLGALYGRPRALLTYREYVAAVKAAHRRAPRSWIGVSRWTEPTWNEEIR